MGGRGSGLGSGSGRGGSDRSSSRRSGVDTGNSLLGDLKDVVLAEGVLREARVEANDIADGVEGLGLDHEALGRDEPLDTLGAGRGGKRAHVAAAKLVIVLMSGIC